MQYHISADTQDSNETLSVIPMFSGSGSGNTEILLGLLSDVWVCWKKKITVINHAEVREK